MKALLYVMFKGFKAVSVCRVVCGDNSKVCGVLVCVVLSVGLFGVVWID